MSDPEEGGQPGSTMVLGADVEEYVRERTMQFAEEFAKKVAPHLSHQDVVSIHNSIMVGGSRCSKPYNGPTGRSELHLIFRHECLYQGCVDNGCVLCKNSPKRRCMSNFCERYFVNDTLRAKCGAPIRLELVDFLSGTIFKSGIPGMKIQLCGLDGQAFDMMVYEHRGICHDQIKACFMLSNNKGEGLLAPANKLRELAPEFITMHLNEGCANLPDVVWTDSSEALLSGRKPPLRLYAFAVVDDDRYNIVPAVSEPFVVATRRAKTSDKAEFPFYTDNVGKLKNMGRETIKKLFDLKASAKAFNVSLDIHCTSIQTVGEFRDLVSLANKDSALRAKLQCILKLNDEKWAETSAHALRSITPDNMLRVWQPDRCVLKDYNLLFACHVGNVDMTLPVAVSYFSPEHIEDETIVKFERLSRPEQDLIRSQQQAWVGSWWSNGHPGWAIHGLETDYLLSCKGPIVLVGSNDSHVAIASASKSPDDNELATAFANDGNDALQSTRNIDKYPKRGSFNGIPSASGDMGNYLDWLNRDTLDNFPTVQSQEAMHGTVPYVVSREQSLTDRPALARMSIDFLPNGRPPPDNPISPERRLSGLYTMRSIEMNLPNTIDTPANDDSNSS